MELGGKQLNAEEWDLLPEYVKQGIQEGLDQAEAGLTIPHEEVKRKLVRWFTAADDKK